MPKFPTGIEVVPITSVRVDPNNTREHEDDNLDAIRASLTKFGQVTPIVVDPDGVVRKGNGTLTAAVALGWLEIAVIRSELSGSSAAAYSIVDNRTTDMSKFDQKKLSASLASIREEDPELLEFTGFSPRQLGNYLPAGEGDAGDWQEEWQGMPEFENEDKTSFQSVHIHFRDQSAVDKFSQLIGQGMTPTTRSMWFPAVEIETTFDKRYAKTDS